MSRHAPPAPSPPRPSVDAAATAPPATQPGNRSRPRHRLCVLIEDFYPVMHGATTQLLLLGERFGPRGVDVVVVTRRIRREHVRRETLPGIEIVRVPPAIGLHRAGKFLMIPGALWALFRHRARYDTIVVSDVKVLGAAGVLAAKVLRKACLLRAESCGELDVTDWLRVNRRAHPILTTIARAVLPIRNFWLRRADRFLSISSPITAEFRAIGVPAARIAKITNGIDAARFVPPDPSQKAKLRRQLSLPDGWLLVYTGRLTAGKGLRWLLEVWRRFSVERRDAHLVLVGSGQGFGADVEAELRQTVQRYGLEDRVTFTGAVTRVADYLQASDCFVLPSQSEALGISLLEAMACGLPCVATAVGGVVDIIEDGSNGLLVPYRDDERLYAALGSIRESRELASTLAERGRSTVLQRFDVDRIADDYITLLEAIENA